MKLYSTFSNGNHISNPTPPQMHPKLVGAAGCTLNVWSGQEVCLGFAPRCSHCALLACCMNLYYTICINMYELVQKPQRVRICTTQFVYQLCEFVFMNSWKKIASRLGFQPGTNMACNRPRLFHPPPHPLRQWPFYLYRTIRTPSEKVDYTVSFE